MRRKHVRLAFVAGPRCSWPHCSIAGACQQFEQKGGHNLTGATRKMFLSIWRNFEKCFLHISLVVRNFWLTISLPFLAVLKLKLTKLAAAAD